MINVEQLTDELKDAGITDFVSVNSSGIVHDANGAEIQKRTDVKDVIKDHVPMTETPQDKADLYFVANKGQSISSMDAAASNEALQALYQRFGLADENGNIK